MSTKSSSHTSDQTQGKVEPHQNDLKQGIHEIECEMRKDMAGLIQEMKTQMTGFQQKANKIVQKMKKKSSDLLVKISTKLGSAEVDLQQRQQTLQEKERNFSNEKRFVAENVEKVKSFVKLNVGGVRYETSRETLTSVSNSMLSAMFSGQHYVEVAEDGSVFIDRDGKLFEHILVRFLFFPFFPFFPLNYIN